MPADLWAFRGRAGRAAAKADRRCTLRVTPIIYILCGRDGLEMICADGGAGLLAALPSAYPGVPVQRFRTHKSVTGDALVSCAGYP
jgi:hypothetical protein